MFDVYCIAHAGTERTRYQTEETSIQGDIYNKNHSFEVTVFEVKRWCISNVPPEQESMPPGEHCFPFAFNLSKKSFASDDGLASSFNYQPESHFGVDVNYFIHAECQVKGMFKTNPRTTKEFIVNSFDNISLPPPETECTEAIMSCCCFGNQGTCYVKASLDKGTYVIGEEVALKLQVINDSNVSIEKVRVFLDQLLMIKERGASNEDFASSATVRSFEFPGYLPHSPLQERTLKISFQHQSANVGFDELDELHELSCSCGRDRYKLVHALGVILITGYENVSITLPICLTYVKTTDTKQVDLKIGDEKHPKGSIEKKSPASGKPASAQPISPKKPAQKPVLFKPPANPGNDNKPVGFSTIVPLFDNPVPNPLLFQPPLNSGNDAKAVSNPLLFIPPLSSGNDAKAVPTANPGNDNKPVPNPLLFERPPSPGNDTPDTLPDEHHLVLGLT